MNFSLGEKLTKLRENKGWTKTFVAEQLNLKALSTYANWEYDARQPDYKMLIKIADLYQISLDELLDRTFIIDAKDSIVDIAEQLEQISENISDNTSLTFNGKPLSSIQVKMIQENIRHMIKQVEYAASLKENNSN